MLSLLCIVVSIASAADNLTDCTVDTHGKVVESIRISNTKSTVREYLSDLPTIYEKLEEIDMDDINIFIHINDKELDILCEENDIVMNKMDTIRFKTAIRRLRTDFASTRIRKIVPISNTEQKAVDEIQYALEETIDIQRIFGKHLDKIESNEMNMRALVDMEVDKLINSIKLKKQSLYKKIEEWKLRKLETMKRELSRVNKYEHTLRETLDDFDGIFRDSNYSRDDRENRILQKKDVMFSNNKIYESLEEYIKINTQIIDIRFDKNASISELNQYGTFGFMDEEEGEEAVEEEKQETELTETTEETAETTQSNTVKMVKFVFSVVAITLALIIISFIWCGCGVQNANKNEEEREGTEERTPVLSG